MKGRIRNASLGTLALWVVAATTGCGYQFQGSGSILPEDVKTVFIAPVENRTTEGALGLKMQESLRSRFERYGVVSVVETAGEADAIMTAKIKSADTKTRNVSGSTDVAVDLSLQLVVAGELKKKNGQILWRDDEMKVSESFAGVGDAVVTSSSDFAQGGIGASTLADLGASEISRGQKSEALENAVDEATRRIYNDAVAADF